MQKELEPTGGLDSQLLFRHTCHAELWCVPLAISELPVLLAAPSQLLPEPLMSREQSGLAQAML